MRAVAAAAVVSLVLVGVYVALGGGSYAPTPAPDPCRIDARSAADGLTGTLERIGLNAIAGAACDLGVSRERVVRALAGDERLGVGGERRTEAFRTGLRRAIDREQDAGRMGGAEAFLLRQAVGVLPIDALLDRLFRR